MARKGNKDKGWKNRGCCADGGEVKNIETNVEGLQVPRKEDKGEVSAKKWMLEGYMPASRLFIYIEQLFKYSSVPFCLRLLYTEKCVHQ